MPVEIFFCYARKDQPFLKKLKAHLIPLERDKLITTWVDTDIDAGKEWEQEINKHLNTAQVILLLVSPNFMNSDYCYSKEMIRAMERHESGEACVIPIILRQTYWQQAPFGKLQALPSDGLSIASWSNQDQAFINVVEGISKIIEKLNKTHEEQQLFKIQQEKDEIMFILQRQLELYQSRAERLQTDLSTIQQRIKELEWLLDQYHHRPQ